MEIVIYVDALDLEIPVPSTAKVLEFGDGERMQVLSEASIELEAIEVVRINAVVRKQAGSRACVLEDGYLDVELENPIEGLRAPLDRAKRVRVTPDGLEFELPAKAAWGKFADSSRLYLVARRSKGAETWDIAPSPRSLDAIDENLDGLDATRCGGLDLRGVRVDRQGFKFDWLPASSERLEWAVVVTGMASIARDTDALLFPVARLHIVVERDRTTLSGSAGEPRDKRRALIFECKPGTEQFESTWPQSGPLTPVLASVPTDDVDRLQLAAGRLWLRSERGWVAVGSSDGDTRWPTTAARSGLLRPLHPWFQSQPGLQIHALLDDVSTTFTVTHGGPTIVKMFDPPLLVELEACAVFEPPDRKAPELPPAPDTALVSLLLVSDAWLPPSSKKPPQQFELLHQGEWTLKAEHTENVIDWRPSSGPPLVGDPRWAANDSDAGLRCSAHRALIPRAVSSRELRLLRHGKGFSLPAPTADRTALRGVMRGLDRGWFGLEIEATDTGLKAGWRHSVAILDERYQSVVAEIAETEGVTSAPLAATRVHEHERLEVPIKAWPNDLAPGDESSACKQLNERLGVAPSLERITAFDRPTGWVLVTADERWGVVREHASALVVSIEPRTLDRKKADEVTITADVAEPCAGSLVLRLRRTSHGWQIQPSIGGHIEVSWANAFPDQSGSRIQTLFFTDLKLRDKDGSVEILAERVELLLGEGRASYECETTRKATLSSDADGKLRVRFEGPDERKDAAGVVIWRGDDEHHVVLRNHLLPGLTLQETLTPTDESLRFQIRINGTDRTRALALDEFEERGDRVIFAFRDSLVGTPVDLLPAGLELTQINLAYLELRRDPHGRLVPVSGIVGWTIEKLAQLVPTVTCHATFKWSREQTASVELNGVWAWPVIAGDWHEDNRVRGRARLDVDLVLIDRSLSLDPHSSAVLDTKLFALGSFELALSERAGDSKWKWMGHVPLVFKPGHPDRAATIDLWGSYRLGIRDHRKQGPKLQLRRGNFGLVLDSRVSNPSKSSCLIHVLATSKPPAHAQATIAATKQELAGHLAAPRELAADLMVPRPQPSSAGSTYIEFIGNTEGPEQVPWLAELMCVGKDEATSWSASSASEWIKLEPVASDSNPPRLQIIGPTGLSVLATMPSTPTTPATPDTVRAWARRVLVRSGWHREAILEDQGEAGLRWQIIDSPRLNRDLELSWLDSAPQNYAKLPGPAGRGASWSDRNRKPDDLLPIAKSSAKPPRPKLVLGPLAERPESERRTSPVVLGLELEPGVDDLLTHEDAVIVRMSRHTPFAWDREAHEFAVGWRPDVAKTGWARESVVAPPTALTSAPEPDRFSAGTVALELRTAAPRPGELLDLELEAWVTHDGVQRSSGRHERRLRTSRAGAGADQIEVEAQTDGDRTEVRWVRRHLEHHDLGDLAILAHEPGAVDADPRYAIRIWIAIDRQALERLRASTEATGEAPRVWLTLALETSAESGTATLTGAADEPARIEIGALRAGDSHDITDRFASDTMVELALQLPEGDGHSRLTISADIAVSKPEQPSVARVLALRSLAAGSPPSTVAVFEHDNGKRSLLAVGPEPASAWRPVVDETLVVWQQVGSWTHHHPPGCQAKAYVVGVLSSIGAWSCSDSE